ncbi:uncharacterized protein MELLADRAFT_101388 [Melampsora larici-populina 98AG31]|uniref:Uncharacterized protein n=1 Tax=Melampsora larici-populina (strain 98AG31 / pathotype 3-4-7) TaxID=747676 RepID=F4R4K7_MELLP|nr:uncharacterized protein MELLADRAFT_101388 [Melampsora larici-populina 98AG31]EGG12982.1 hypothetical protein MELLADRAFT_101388 [Melampsora larici-populina 98AG31]
MASTSRSAEEKKLAQAEERRRRAESRAPKEGEGNVDMNLIQEAGQIAREEDLLESHQVIHGAGPKAAFRESKGADSRSQALLEALTHALDTNNGVEARKLVADFNDSYGSLVAMDYDGYVPPEPKGSVHDQPSLQAQESQKSVPQAQTQQKSASSRLMDSSQLLALISGPLPFSGQEPQSNGAGTGVHPPVVAKTIPEIEIQMKKRAKKRKGKKRAERVEAPSSSSDESKGQKSRKKKKEEPSSSDESDDSKPKKKKRKRKASSKKKKQLKLTQTLIEGNVAVGSRSPIRREIPIKVTSITTGATSPPRRAKLTYMAKPYYQHKGAKQNQAPSAQKAQPTEAQNA